MGYEYKENGLVLFIKDSGIGIPKEKSHILFEHFEKLNEFAQGAGLGLPICKAITEAMGGKVGVESTEGGRLHLLGMDTLPSHYRGVTTEAMVTKKTIQSLN